MMERTPSALTGAVYARGPPLNVWYQDVTVVYLNECLLDKFLMLDSEALKPVESGVGSVILPHHEMWG